MDIIVTVPKKEKQNLELEEEFAQENQGNIIQYWSVPKQPQEINIGDRVYFIVNGVVTHWHEFTGFDFDAVCEVTGRVWPGLNLVLKYLGTDLENPVPMKGFQGFHYDKKSALRGGDANA